MGKRVVAIIIKSGKILLMGRVKNGERYFVFPGGGVEEGEEIERALPREIKEEFDLDVKIEKPLFQLANRGRKEFYFLVQEFTGLPEVSGEEKERMSDNNQYFPVWMELKEALKLPTLYPKRAREKLKRIDFKK